MPRNRTMRIRAACAIIAGYLAMFAYACTIFLSAFLLFAVQPMIGKIILPWFGGSAAVWSTCLLFFQAALLAGYFYARPFHAPAEAQAAGYAAHRSDGLQPGAASRAPFADLEAVARRRSFVAHFAAAHCNHRVALLIALDHQPVTPGLVRCGETRRDSVSAVRAIEFWFAARAAELSGVRGTGAHHS